MADASTTAMASDAMADPDVKTVYLVRHAQSEQNIATAKLERGDVGALADIVRLGYDAPCSARGKEQLAEAASKLNGFAKNQGIELVAHSPYQRAVATAKALFAGHPQPFALLPSLHERTLTEYLFPSLLHARIQKVRDWLDTRPETCIALVGHGQWFQHAVGAARVQPNVSIIRTKYSRATGFVADDGPLVFAGFSEPKPGDT